METFRRETVYKDFLIVHQRDNPNNEKCYYTVVNDNFQLKNKKGSLWEYLMFKLIKKLN